jgi:hypothetical protein
MSRSVTPEMPTELRAGFVKSAFEDVFGTPAEERRGVASEAPGGDNRRGESGKAWAGVASYATRVGQARQMAGLTEKLGMGEEEEKLTLALAAGLDKDVEHVAEMVVLSRVTKEQVQAHALEVGVAKMLTAHVKSGMIRFAMFVLAAEKLGLVAFEVLSALHCSG